MHNAAPARGTIRGKHERQGFEKRGGGGLTSVTVLLSEARRLQEGHLSVRVQVFLVATKDDDDVGARQRARVCQPVGEGVVRLPAMRRKAGYCGYRSTYVSTFHSVGGKSWE